MQIQAVNAIGSSPLSPPLLARTRPLPPSPPPLECAAAGPQSLKLKWGENASSLHARALLADDMVYTLQMEDKNHRCGSALALLLSLSLALPLTFTTYY